MAIVGCIREAMHRFRIGGVPGGLFAALLSPPYGVGVSPGDLIASKLAPTGKRRGSDFFVGASLLAKRVGFRTDEMAEWPNGETAKRRNGETAIVGCIREAMRRFRIGGVAGGLFAARLSPPYGVGVSPGDLIASKLAPTGQRAVPVCRTARLITGR